MAPAAGRALGLGEIVPVRVSLENAFVPADTPWLEARATMVGPRRFAGATQLVLQEQPDPVTLLVVGSAGVEMDADDRRRWLRSFAAR